MKKFKKYFLIIIIFFSFLTLILASEFIYIYNNEPQRMYSYYLKNLTSIKLPNKEVDHYRQKITAFILYKYLELEEKRIKNIELCDPLCLDYNEFQNIRRLFEELELTNSLSELDYNQKSKLFFWLAAIDVWHDDNEKALNSLKKSISFSKKNAEAISFYEDFNKLSTIINDPNTRSYFRDKLNSGNKIKQYEEKYLAKAAFELGKIYLSDNQIKEAELYLNKSISINPWRLDPYLILSDIHIDQKNPEEAKNILKKCIIHLKKDSIPCKKKLDLINTN